ncbi:MAG: biopolymer transporter ExbD [Sphingobacteriaceae bacterium]|nr:MAG: biopolymer transporter ExbD [Sphingobacteriaceae bacterium]
MAELNSDAPRSGRKTRKRIAARVDLTAMVDLAFLLITFFIFTTTLNKQKVMPVAMPDKEGNVDMSVPASRTLTICPGDNNKLIWYVGEAEKPLLGPYVADYSKNGIRKAIIQAKDYARKATGKHLIAIIKPADTSEYSDLVNALDEMEINDVQSYAITDISNKDISLLKDKGIY